MKATRPYYKYIHEKMAQHLDAAEVRTLCFNLGIEYEDLPGEGRAEKLLSFIERVEKRGLAEDFVKEVTRARPDVLWKQPSPPIKPLPLGLQDLADNNHAHVLFYQSLQCVEEKLALVKSEGTARSFRMIKLEVESEKHGGQLLSHAQMVTDLYAKYDLLTLIMQRARVLSAVALALSGLALLVWLVVMLVLLGG